MTCNNCGNAFHSYRYCKIPITSNGIIHVTSDLKYLMIRRRKTLGYMDFIRGRYALNNAEYITNLIDEMTLAEKNDILTKNFQELSSDLWDRHNEDHFARDKFTQLKRGVLNNGVVIINLEQIVARSTTSWITQEWGFPKGRRNSNETELGCALREYEEETGFCRESLILIKNVLPYEEIFTGSNYKSYKHKYFVGFGSTVALKSYQTSEVSDLQFFTYEEALEKIRPYNVERKSVLSHVNTVLKEYFSIPSEEKFQLN